MITLKGIAARDVVYTVNPRDWTVNGLGGGGTASFDQTLTNIARRLVDAINQAGGRKVWASSQGGLVTLVALDGGSAGSYALSGSLNRLSGNYGVSDLAIKASGAASGTQGRSSPAVGTQ